MSKAATRPAAYHLERDELIYTKTVLIVTDVAKQWFSTTCYESRTRRPSTNILCNRLRSAIKQNV